MRDKLDNSCSTVGAICSRIIVAVVLHWPLQDSHQLSVGNNQYFAILLSELDSTWSFTDICSVNNTIFEYCPNKENILDNESISNQRIY